MKKFAKLTLLFFILIFTIFSFTNFVYADQNTTTGNSTTEQTQSNNVNQTTAINQSNTTNQTNGQITTTVRTAYSSENELFSPTNIINILLIAVGIVLILLSIAIFTRLKK